MIQCKVFSKGAYRSEAGAGCKAQHTPLLNEAHPGAGRHKLLHQQGELAALLGPLDNIAQVTMHHPCSPAHALRLQCMLDFKQSVCSGSDVLAKSSQ